MKPQALLCFGAFAAILGGGLRIAAAFVPYTPESPALETLYATIDVALLFGLTAIYVRESQALGWPGLTAFCVAFVGLASIVGPDATVFGVDWYQAGAGVAALGMAAFGGTLLAARHHVLPALCWLAVPLVAIAAAAPLAAQAAGILFGTGFVLAGFSRITPPAAGKG